MKLISKAKIALILFVPVVYFLASFITLKDYGISWDEPLHFARGQAYFRYLTTGEKNYDNLSGRKSLYQNDSLNGEYFLQNDSAHPPAGDIIAAGFNFIFYQKLGILGDIESLHLFNVFISTIGVLVVCLFAYETMGFWPAIFSGLAISTYPLFFGEGHFNIKDPAETTFFALAIYFFWKSLKKFEWKYLIAFCVSVGLALGTKFNIVFLPAIVVPYFLIRLKKDIFKIPAKYYLGLLISSAVAVGVFYLLWPYLWEHPVGNFVNAVKYYKDIGVGTVDYQIKYLLPGGFNIFPLYWIIITTPPLTLLLSLLGSLAVFWKKNPHKDVQILWLLWLLLPILRVSVPQATIYGGIRQIMEYIPAMALLAGAGAGLLMARLKVIGNKSLGFLFFLVTCVLLLIPIVRLHPNENVYFNFFIGGLKGASERKVPYYGNSFGNAYLQAVKWLNVNSELNSKLALVQGTITNIPRIWLRSDISFSNGYWSGIDRKGEYLVELTHDDPVKVYPYVWGYVDKFLKPIHEVQVDGVTIAKIWKNDLENTYPSLQRKELILSRGKYQVEKDKNSILISFSEFPEVTRIKFSFTKSSGCSAPSGYVEISDRAGNWGRVQETFPALQMEKAYNEDSFTFFLSGDELSAAKFVFDKSNSCAFNNTKLVVHSLER